MTFDPNTVTSVFVDILESELVVRWNADSNSTSFQVYCDRSLCWSGHTNQCFIAIPVGAYGRNVIIDVVSVDPIDLRVDFSSKLAAIAPLSNRVKLSWLGGTYLDNLGRDQVDNFLIQGSAITTLPSEGNSQLSTTIPAYPGGWISDGFGLGLFGSGGFGRSATLYSWTSDPLASGVWDFGVVARDASGNQGILLNWNSLTVHDAPSPILRSNSQILFRFSYSGSSNRYAILTWSS